MIALILVLVLVSATTPAFVWAVLLALLAGLAAVVAVCSPRGTDSGRRGRGSRAVGRRPPQPGRLTRQLTEKLAIMAMSSCSRLWQWKTYRPG